MTTARDNSEALAALSEASMAAAELLAELSALTETRFGTEPDRVHWGHVGSAGEVVSLLARALQAAKGIA